MNWKILISFLAISSIHAESYDPKDFAVDIKTGKWLHVCGKYEDKLVLKEVCANSWPSIYRTRADVTMEAKEVDGIKKGDVVMVRVRKSDDQIHWVLTSVNTVFENGEMELLEYYDKRTGYSPGTKRLMAHKSIVAKKGEVEAFKMESEWCAKEDFELAYDYDNSRKFKFNKGEKVKLHVVYNNQMAQISYKDTPFFTAVLGYGFRGTLPVSVDKLIKCESDSEKIEVNQSSRNEAKKIESISSDDKTNYSKEK